MRTSGNRFFFKIDIQSFYYAIARQRVTRVLLRYRMQGALPTQCGPVSPILTPGRTSRIRTAYRLRSIAAAGKYGAATFAGK